MIEDNMDHAQVQPLWGAIDDMAKGEKREILFKESGYRCMACGKRWENTGVWSMSQIIPVRHSRQVRLDGRTIICEECRDKKGHASVPGYVGTLPFRKRLAYWSRVDRACRKGLITQHKRNLLLSGFNPFRRIRNKKIKKRSLKYSKLLWEETRGTCIYCGIPLSTGAVTYDHIIPRSLGGRSCFENYVIACPDCNVAKGNLPVDEFIKSYPEKKRITFVHRVNDMVRCGRMPKKKANILLNFENRHTRCFRFRFFRRLFTVTVSQTRI